MSEYAAHLAQLPKASPMKLPIIDRIWRVRGTIAIDPALGTDEAFARLDPLVRTANTAVQIEGNTLTYAKDNPAAQDKLAAFTRGTLTLERVGAGAVLRFDLFSHALLMAFLAPLLFLGFAQLANVINSWEKTGAQASEAEEPSRPVKALHPVDQFLGAPAPDDPNKAKDKEKDEGRHSPDEGYFMAGLFAAIYLVGRWLEPWLARRRFRAALSGPPAT